MLRMERCLGRGREAGRQETVEGWRRPRCACPGELNWMGTCWGSRCACAWDLGLGTGTGTGTGNGDWDWGELIFVGGYLPVELAKSYLLPHGLVGQLLTQVAHTLHATAHIKVCLMPELAPGRPLHATPSVSWPGPLPVKAHEAQQGIAAIDALHATLPLPPTLPTPPLRSASSPIHPPSSLATSSCSACASHTSPQSTSPTPVADYSVCPFRRG